MTGKAYYITTLGDWQRHAARFANSHFIVLKAPATSDVVIPNQAAACADEGRAPGSTASRAREVSEGSAVAVRDENQKQIPRTPGRPLPKQEQENSRPSARDDSPQNGGTDVAAVGADARILVLIEADEGVHLSLEDEPAFEALPHPLAQKPISDAAQAALAPHGVAPGATTFDAAEALARIHPLLRHRVF